VIAFIRPCNPIRATKPPGGEAWLHEPKLDGYRLQIVKSGRAVRLYSRNGHEWTERLAALADALAGIPGRSAVIDAELCFLTGIGAPDFAGLQLALRSRQHHKLMVFAFDLLHRDGVDLCPLPLSQRKHLLATLLHRSKVDCLHLVATFPDGAKLLASAERMQLEGIVSKRRSSPYRSGECKDWRKIKTAAWRAANRERWRMFERGRM
jgi:bifunctional non-homologous end joining protein LigD